MMRNPARCRAHNERKSRKPRHGHRHEDYRHRNGPSGRHIGANKLRENRAEESASSRLRQLERRGLGNADEGGVLCQTHCPGSRGLCRRDSTALRMDVRGIKAAELFKLRDKKSLAVTLGPCASSILPRSALETPSARGSLTGWGTCRVVARPQPPCPPTPRRDRSPSTIPIPRRRTVNSNDVPGPRCVRSACGLTLMRLAGHSLSASLAQPAGRSRSRSLRRPREPTRRRPGPARR